MPNFMKMEEGTLEELINMSGQVRGCSMGGVNREEGTMEQGQFAHLVKCDIAQKFHFEVGEGGSPASNLRARC